MKRLFAIISILSLTTLMGCSEINDRLDDLESRVDGVENTQLASIKQQIAAINTTIANLEKTSSDLKSYILTLQDRAIVLENSINTTNKKLAELKESLEAEIDSEIALVITQLEGVKSEIEAELKTVKSLIIDLQNKDKELEEKISTLRNYVNSEISKTKDWVAATFATLEQYNILANDVAKIEGDIQTINSLITALEENINERVEQIIKDSLDGIKDEVFAYVLDEISSEYTAAISTARTEITKAYEQAIKNAIAQLENSMKSWVNSQLTGYYTISQVDAKLDALTIALENKINASEEYLEGVISTLETAIEKKIGENSELITKLSNDISSINADIAQHATAIINNTSAIQQNTEAIKANAQQIMENISDISSNATLIASNKTLISANTALIRNNQNAISALQTKLSNAQQAIQTNAQAIANNAADIATNAALIANNASAISNNISAIATNTTDIANLRQLLAETASAITSAYKSAIESAITQLNGELRDHISEQISAVNSSITALASRVSATEKEINNIKVFIYTIQEDIATLQKQVAEIMARIQSISYIPKYTDGKANMYYNYSSGALQAGEATLDFEVRPAAVATELLDVWQSALSVKAIYTTTRSTSTFIALDIESITASDGILTITIKGNNLSEQFFRSEVGANVRLEISDGANCLTTDYIPLIPVSTETIYFADENFETYLVTNFDLNSDGQISIDEAEAVTAIGVGSSNIKSLAGIEFFPNLTYLDCSANEISKIDLSHNTKLTTLNISGNLLTSLNLGNNTALITVNCSNNALSSLDVSELTALKTLYCTDNSLLSLDLSNNKALITLDCSNNELVSLSVASNTALVTLDCSGNMLTSLTLGGLPTSIDCSDNQLTALNLVGQNTLITLDCSGNAIRELNVTTCTKLRSMDCADNNLQSLNVSNLSDLSILNCSGNADLAQIWMKDILQEAVVILTKDSGTTIRYHDGGIYIPDMKFETYLLNNYDDDGDGYITNDEAANITMVNCANMEITDLTGLESCPNLEVLNCSGNSITQINLPNLSRLQTIRCYDNPIEYVNINGCTSLQALYMQNNSNNATLTTGTMALDNYTQAASLTICATGSGITTFDIINSATLEQLNLADTEAVSLSCDNSAILKSIVYPNTLTYLDIDDCPALTVDVTPLSLLETLYVRNNGLEELNVQDNTKLVNLYCDNNSLTSLNLTNNTLLKNISCGSNSLSALNVRFSPLLETLDISNTTTITMMNLTENTSLNKFTFTGSTNLTTVRVDNDFSMDECEFISTDNNPGLSIYNSNGEYFYFIGQYTTAFGAEGIVFHTSNRGLNGGLISVKETLGYWDDITSWCTNYGENWYIPTIQELTELYTKRYIVNSTLTALGYQTLASDRWWWSSSVYIKPGFGYTYRYVLDFSDGDDIIEERWSSSYHAARAAFTF